MNSKIKNVSIVKIILMTLNLAGIFIFYILTPNKQNDLFQATMVFIIATPILLTILNFLGLKTNIKIPHGKRAYSSLEIIILQIIVTIVLSIFYYYATLYGITINLTILWALVYPFLYFSLVRQLPTSELNFESSEQEKDEVSQFLKSGSLVYGFIIAKNRLISEKRRLINNSIVNLFIALVLTIVAIIILSSYPLNQFEDLSKTLGQFIPKFSIAILIEVFAFFFLKMYKNNLDEVKYYQNELTNLDLKTIALDVALSKDHIENKNLIIDELLRTERNFILKSGETTVEIEKGKFDFKTQSELLSIIKEFLNSRPK